MSSFRVLLRTFPPKTDLRTSTTGDVRRVGSDVESSPDASSSLSVGDLSDKGQPRHLRRYIVSCPPPDLHSPATDMDFPGARAVRDAGRLAATAVS
jgi:hypothetical protein